MGLLSAAFVLWLIRSARNRFAKDGSGFKLSFLVRSAYDEQEGVMINTKDHESSARYAKNSATKWADGLRGVAAVGVVSSHLCLSFWQQLITPTIGGPNGHAMLFQRPILRLVVQGQSFVALFFILMGFVNSLKPLKQVQVNQTEEALLTLAGSALTRTTRLVLPASTVTVLAWLACQLRFNEIARKSNAYWLYTTCRGPIPGFVASLVALKDALIACWVWGDNAYDQPQWALKWLLIGSFWIFCILLMTITTRPLFRLFVLFAAYMYSWVAADFILGTNLYFGIFLAQVHIILSSRSAREFSKRTQTVLNILPFITATLGLYLMSYPSDYANDAPWSRNLLRIGLMFAPGYADMARFWASIGAQLLCISIYFSPTLKRLFSTPLTCYLGSVSFSLYLLHGPLMRSALAIMVFGPAFLKGTMVKGHDDFLRYPIPPTWTFLITLPLFGAFLMVCVHLWSIKVEPLFARATKALENFATGKEGQKSPLQQPVNGKGNLGCWL